MILHQLLPLFALGLNILLLGSALVGDRRNQRNYVFAALAAALAVWNLGVFGLRSTDDIATAIVYERIVHVGVIVLPVLFYHYVLVFLECSRRRELVAAYVLTAIFLVASPTALFMPGVTRTAWGFAPQSGPLYAPFFLFFQACMVFGLVRLVRAYRATGSSFRRNRTRLVIFGGCISVAGGVVDFLRFIVNWEHLYPVGIPTSAVFAVALGIAIVRYRLGDVRVLAKRLLLYGLLALVLTPIIVGGLRLVDWLAADHMTSTLSLGAVVLGVLALMLPFVRTMEGWIESVMFARQRGVRDALVGLGQDMPSMLDLPRLGQTLTERLVQRVPVVHAALHVAVVGDTPGFQPFARAVSRATEGDPGPRPLDQRLALWLRLTRRPLALEELAQQAIADPSLRPLARDLEAARVALLLPLLVDDEVAAIVVVGEKMSAEVFDGAEVELLEMLMGQTAIAFKNCRLYEDLRRQMEELRTTQQQLIQSAKLAAVGELAASVAHELASPLTVILGMTGLIRSTLGDDTVTDARLATIEEETARAAKITRSLLDFSRRREPQREPINLNTLVPRVLDIVESKLRGRAIEVETPLDAGLPVMVGDADQLLQVLINLTGNAIDAMPKGGRLVIRTAAEPETDSVLLGVTDTGLGMTAEQVAQIFEPFYTTKAEGKGTGLGLSISLGIVRHHGGTISVESAPGAGTTMTIRLPVLSVREPSREAALS
jgi:signal transduction histidine kinase